MLKDLRRGGQDHDSFLLFTGRTVVSAKWWDIHNDINWRRWWCWSGGWWWWKIHLDLVSTAMFAPQGFLVQTHVCSIYWILSYICMVVRILSIINTPGVVARRFTFLWYILRPTMRLFTNIDSPLHPPLNLDLRLWLKASLPLAPAPPESSHDKNNHNGRVLGRHHHYQQNHIICIDACHRHEEGHNQLGSIWSLSSCLFWPPCT